MDANTYELGRGLSHPVAMPRPDGKVDALGKAEDVFTIGDLAREFGTTLRALRFYEDKGLIAPRRDGMTRLYSATDRERLKVILKGKQLGFTLAEIRALVAAHTGAAADHDAAQGLALTRERCLKQLAQLERQRGEIDSAIAELQSIANSLAA